MPLYMRPLLHLRLHLQASIASAPAGGGSAADGPRPRLEAVVEVAHDLRAIQGCSRVVVMEGGRVVEAGPPAELMRRPGGHFARLHRAMTGGSGR